MTISSAYSQLAGIFETLENSRFKPDQDFGANIAGCFCWYLSPSAVMFLEKEENPFWLKLKANQQFKWNFEKWQGYHDEAVNIKLNL